VHRDLTWWHRAALDGVDLIVFTRGIGENDAKVRAEICGGLPWMGIVLDEVRNRAVTNPISDPTSRCAVGTLVANRLTRVDAAEG
jgi:acetate kinase